MTSALAVQIVTVLSASLAATVLLTPLVLAFAHARGIYDVPDARHVHAVPTPRLGGIAVFIALLVAAAIALTTEPLRSLVTGDTLRFFIAVLAGAALLFGTGLVDDIVGIRARTKLLVQVVAALLVIHAGWAPDAVHIVPGMELALPAWAMATLILLWIVAATNAMNLIDGMDGLAGSIALVGFIAVTASAAVFGRSGTVLLGAAGIGAAAGFLIYNWSPARIFLGDSGSLILGFLLATLTLRSATSHAGVLHVLLPLSVLAVPLIDMSFSIGRRWLRGTPVFGADRRHLHHQLLARHMSHGGAALLLAGISAGSVGAGFLGTFAPEHIAGTVFVLGVLGLVAFIAAIAHWLEYHEFETAITVVSTEAPRLRRDLQDRLRARDIIAQLPAATSLERTNTLLRSHTTTFGFDAIAVRRHDQIGAPRGNSVIVLPLDVDGAWVLLIATRPELSGRAERVGSCIAQALRSALAIHTATESGAAVVPLIPRARPA